MRFYAARIGAIRPDVDRIEADSDGTVKLHHPDGLTRFAASKHQCTLAKGTRLAKPVTFLDRIPERFERMTAVRNDEPRYFASETDMPMMPAPQHAEAETLLGRLLAKGRPVVLRQAPAAARPKAAAEPAAVNLAAKRAEAEAEQQAQEEAEQQAKEEAEQQERRDRQASAALNAAYTEAIEKAKRCRNPVLKKRFIATAEKIHAKLVAAGPVPPPAPAELLA